MAIILISCLSGEANFPGGSDGKVSAYSAGDLGSILGSGRSSGEANGNPLQYSCLENLMDGGVWWAILHIFTKSWTRLSNFTFHFQSSLLISMICIRNKLSWTSLVAQTVKHLPTVQETWVQSLRQEDLLEKEMATHSSILAWEIPWMEEPGRLQTMGSQRVRHDRASHV